MNDVLGDMVRRVASDPTRLRRFINVAMDRLEELDQAARRWAERNIAATYSRRNIEVVRKLRATGIGDEKKDRSLVAAFSKINDGTIQSLLYDPDAGFLALLFAATGKIRQRLRRLERSASRLKSRRQILEAVSAELEAEKLPGVSGARMALDSALSKAETSKAAIEDIQEGLDAAAELPFVRTESGRHMRLDRYAEMVARVKVVQTDSLASRNGVLEAGGRFVKVSDNLSMHGDACDLFIGKVFALTRTAAAASGLPHVSELPGGGTPFHPHCTHHEEPYLETSIEPGSLPRPPEWSLRKSWREVQRLFEERRGRFARGKASQTVGKT